MNGQVDDWMDRWGRWTDRWARWMDRWGRWIGRGCRWLAGWQEDLDGLTGGI